jgi:F-type H+-transporting ATPase subunit epsilon
MSAFQWSVSTPDGPVASGTCWFLVVPTTRGELGVMAGHAALVACVAAGDLRVTSTEGTVTSIPVGPGIIEVRENAVHLLLSSAPHS